MTDESSAMANLTIEQKLKRITFNELCSSIHSALNADRLGTPVNVRLHWEFAESESVLTNATIIAVAVADEALQLDKPEWRVRRHASGKTINVMGSDKNGRTLMITLVAHSKPATALTIFGNHGIVRLEEGWIDLESAPDSFTDRPWAADLQAALGD